MFRSRDIIFEERTTNFTTQVNSKDIFDYVQIQQNVNIHKRKEDNGKQTISQQAITLWPLNITRLHKLIAKFKS